MQHKAFRRFLRRFPVLRNFLRRVYRNGQYVGARLLGKMRHDDLFLIYVNPLRIQMTVKSDDPTLTGNAVWHVGTVADGDWDLGGVPVGEHGGVGEILAGHVIGKRPLATIPAYQSNLQRIEQGDLIDGCTTTAEYQARWQEITALYARMQAEGYQTQVELGSENLLDEIRVQIGRHGDFLFEEGLHRLVIAQTLNLSFVPVLVTRRHADWAQLRNAVLKIVLQRGFIHQPFDHPDLDSLPVQYGNELATNSFYGHERWDFIRENLPFTSGSVLDIGAYFGYFDHRLEAFGFDCFAVEPDAENLVVLNLYRTMQKRQFSVWSQSVFEIDRHEFDLVLALNIFHHLVRTKSDYEKLKAFLRRLRCRSLYFEPDDNAGIDAYCHFSDSEFIEFVQTHTGLTQVQFLGRAKEGRGVYLLSE